MELAKVFYSVYFGHANKIIIGSTGLGGRRRGGVFFFFFEEINQICGRYHALIIMSASTLTATSIT